MQKDMAFHMEIAAISDNVLMQEVSRLLFTLTTAKRTEVTKRLLEHEPALFDRVPHPNL